jgi:hypothetical protein
MTYKYQIVIKPIENGLSGLPWNQENCRVNFEHKNQETINNFITCYGSSGDVVVFLKELIDLLNVPPQDQSTNWTCLSREQLIQEIDRLSISDKSSQYAKQELEKRVSELSQTKENRQVEKLQSEKAEIKRDRDLLDKKNYNSEVTISQLKKNSEKLQQQLKYQQTQDDLNSQEVRTLRHDNLELERELTAEKKAKQQYNQDSINYVYLRTEWDQLFPNFTRLNELADCISSLTEAKEKLQKSKQNSDKRVQDIEQELQETQQKLALATSRLREVNIHSELGGGGSRSDQLKNEFSHLKSSTLHEVSTKVLMGWQSEGFKSTAKNDFKSEEFFKLKLILSQRVFGDGMAYFAKDKIAVDGELHQVMNALQSIKDFNPTSAVFQEIQKNIQEGLLRSKGVDNSEESLLQYIEKTTQFINQELQPIANLSTTDEALHEIKNFVKAGLNLIRDIVNDINSGELFISENGTVFDDNAHDTKDDHKGQIKMTICAGYRIKGTVLVKADVMTHELKVPSPNNEPDPVNSQTTDSQNPQAEGEIQENNSSNISKVEETRNISDLSTGQVESVSTELLSSGSSQEHQEVTNENPNPKGLEKPSTIFSGKVTCKEGVSLRSRPSDSYRTNNVKQYDDSLNFEGWVTQARNNDPDARWYKLAEQDYWVPACFIKGEPPKDMLPMEYSGGDDEAL